MHKLLLIFFVIALHLFCSVVHAQATTDSIPKDSTKVIADSTVKKAEKKFDPRVATRRSAQSEFADSAWQEEQDYRDT